MRCILFLLSSFVILAGAAAVAHSDEFSASRVLNGSVMTQKDCDYPNTSIWISVDGKGECIRYFHSGLERSNAVVHVWLHGDRITHSRGTLRVVGYRNVTRERLQEWAERGRADNGIPYIRLSRPGTYGSSGFHTQRRRPRNVRMVLAAFDALKKKYSIDKFAISGQSGGGHLVGALLADRHDIVCAVSTSGVLAVRQRIRARRWLTDITGYSDFYDPIDHVGEIARDNNRRIFIVGDPRDDNVPYSTQLSYYRRLREYDHTAYMIPAKGSGRRRHGLTRTGFWIVNWCAEGVSSAEILDRASRRFAPD